MTGCDLETSVPDWIIEHPETLAVFQELGVDYSCGGKSLEYACQERGLEPHSVLDKLRRRILDARNETPS
jgi:iron-sulfur cluster repair protein YtfE (RIC family)